MGIQIVKRNALLKVAKRETMWDRVNLKRNQGRAAVLDKRYRITPYTNEVGAQTKAFSGAEEIALMPKLINLNATSPQFFDRCEMYWQSIHHIFDSNGLALDISFRVDSSKLEDFEKAPEDEKYKHGSPTNLLQYMLYRYCLNWVCVANSYNAYKANQHAKKLKFYFYTADEVRAEIRDKNTRTIEAMQAYVKASADKFITEGILRHFELSKTAHTIEENIGKSYTYEGLDDDQRLEMLLHIQQTVPALFVELVKDPDLKMRTFIHRCCNVKLLNKAAGSTMINYGDTVIGQTMEQAVMLLKSNNELKEELKLKLKAMKS